MKTLWRAVPAFCAVVAAVASLEGCGAGGEAERSSMRSLSKEELFREGNLLYLQQQFDTAAVLLKRSYSMDSSYTEPALALASLNYDRGRQETAGSRKATEFLRQSLWYYRRVEEAGNLDAMVLDRLCEVSVLVRDDRAFARYAKKNAELYPYDRQTYNLGLAYYGVEDYQTVVKTQKDAIERFKTSPYLGGFYRLVGLAYVKQGRDQTAEKTFLSGIKAVEARLGELKRSEKPPADAIARLGDDRVGMLQQLKKLFQIYKKQEELEQVERQLKDAGQTK